MAAVQRLIIVRCLDLGTVTSDVAHQVTRPLVVHPSTIGAAICGLVRDRIIVMAEVTMTTRAEAPGRLIRRWRLADRHAAAQWLSTHPADADRGEG